MTGGERPSALAAQEWERIFSEEWRAKVIRANAIDQHRALLTLKGYRQCEGEVSALLICDVQPGAGPCRTGCKRCEESCTCGADPEPLDYCNAVVWIEESDGVIAHYSGPDIPVHSGPAEVWWDGDTWRWGLMTAGTEPAAQPNPLNEVGVLRTRTDAMAREAEALYRESLRLAQICDRQEAQIRTLKASTIVEADFHGCDCRAAMEGEPTP